jgi:hypothetical protein
LRIKNVGVIGLGTTGSAVACRLLDQGLEVTVHDRNAWTVATLVEAGAKPARIPADAAEPADLVFLHVPDEPATEEVLFDLGGVGETLPDGGVIVSAAATSSAFILSAADRLRALGLHLVEAWVTGGTDGTPATVLVGGAPEHLELVAPALRAVADEVAHIGPLGSVSALRTMVSTLTGLRPASSPAADLRQVLPALISQALRAPVSDLRPADRETDAPSPVPAGVLTLQELAEVVDGVRRDSSAPIAAGAEQDGDANCLGLAAPEFDGVITELEQRCRIPLLHEARQCSTPAELVGLVNTQVMSGV